MATTSSIRKQLQPAASTVAAMLRKAGGVVQLGAEMPADTVSDMAYAEILLHGWDVARTIGTDVEVTPEMAAALRETVEQTADLPLMGVYGPKVTCPLPRGLRARPEGRRPQPELERELADHLVRRLVR